MSCIGGNLEAGEASGARSVIAARQRGSAIPFFIAMLALTFGGGMIGASIGGALGYSNTGISPLIGLVVGAVAYTVIARLWLTRTFRRRMRDRGLDTRLRHSLVVSDAGLALDLGRVRKEADWAAVTEVFRTKKYWIFLVQTEPWFAPVCFFANPSDERAFLAAALSHMSEAARDRSKKAMAFVGS